jgi:hypothetical protein
MLDQPDEFGRFAGGDRLDPALHEGDRLGIIDRRRSNLPFDRRRAGSRQHRPAGHPRTPFELVAHAQGSPFPEQFSNMPVCHEMGAGGTAFKRGQP